ncbi:OmpA family protein [Kaistia adipata]|uniref:OmpA family protein n=1 Tax=Kaistia adipata TaxID=166954 RepID=UPI0004007948|nr:OmpA family protein [Kaistia adipata]
MNAWRRCLVPGLVVITLLTVVALGMTSGRIGRDIGERVDAQLAIDGQPWATANVSGRSVTVMGTSPTLLAQRLAVESAERVWGVSRVVDGSGVIPLQSPYRWSAKRDGDGIVIEGYAPSDEARLAILASAKRNWPTAPITETLELARGQPIGFLVLTDFAMQRLAELAEGSVSLVGAALSVDGTALDETRFTEAAQALSTGPPGGGQLRNVRVLPPRSEQFAWRLAYDGKTISMSGFVPSVAVRRDIIDALATSLPGTPVEDTTQLASGVPDGFAFASVFAAYQMARLSTGEIRIDGASLSVEGKAKTVADYEMALAEIEARKSKRVAGVGVGTIDLLPAAVDPYVWRADHAGDSVVLTGYVPSIVAHDEVVATARRLFPEHSISDHVRVADGDPKMDWIGALKYALDQLVLLEKGSVSLTGRKYDIVGEAASSAAYSSLTEALKKTLPASMELRRSAVSPGAVSPFVFAAARSPDALTLSGYVPTDEVVQKIVASARPKFGSDRIELRLLLAGGVPDGFVDAVDVALQAVSRLHGGRFDLVDTRLSLSGVAVSEGARQAIEAALKADLPENFELTASLMVAVGGDPLTGPQCQLALRNETEREKVQFDGSTARILPASFGLLDRVAAIVQRCPIATVEIGSHTDSQGGTRKNQALSVDRANAVVDHLVADGLRRERLKPVGYGSSRPIASNSKAAGRAQNRRIEFGIVGQ